MIQNGSGSTRMELDHFNEKILDSSPNIIFAKNREGVYKMVNRSMLDFIGLKKHEIIGFTDEHLVDDTILFEKYRNEDNFVVETGENFEGEPTQMIINGEARWFRTVKSPLVNEKDEIIGVLGIVSEVSELIRSKDLIKEQEKLLSTVYNSGNDFILVVAPTEDSYVYVSCNESYVTYLQAFGLEVSSEWLNGIDMLEFAQEHNIFTGDRAAKAKKSLDKVRSSKKTYGFTDITVLPGKRSSTYIDMEMNPILNDFGDVKYIVCRGRDFSELMRYNKQLQEREELLNSINRNVQDGIYRSTVDSGLKYANDAMCRMFGYSLNELAKTKPGKLYVNPEDRHEVVEKLHNKGSFSDREVLFQRKDGSQFWGLMSCSMTMDPDGTQIIDGIIVDVSHDREVREILKSTNEDLRKINSELDHLVYRTSHDLRSPIASAMGLCELLRLEGLNGDSKDFVDMLEDQLSNLDKVIVDIINIRKIAKTGLQAKKIEIDTILNEILTSFKFLENYQRTETKVELELDEEFFQDENKIRIVLNNLISNSIKYMDPSKQQSFLNIHVKVDAEQLMLVVQDNGIGISDDHVSKVFEMFYRATAHNTGTGLGLFIVKEAVDKLEGTIQLETKYGKGTKFCVTIPNRK